MLLSALLLIIVTWIGAGSVLLYLRARPAGRDFLRQVDRRVARVGEDVEISLRLVPPVAVGLVEDHDVVLVLDHSGSMGAGPASALGGAIRAAESFVRRCPPQIHIGVVAFDHQARILCPVSGDARTALAALKKLSSGGGTAIDLGLERAAEAVDAARADIAKTVILLSDGGSERAAATAAADALHSAGVGVLTVGFGSSVDRELMIAVAGGEERYSHVSNSRDLAAVFAFLAAAVSGQMAIAGLVDEATCAPSPFRLAHTGGLYPIGVHADAATRIVWSVPLLDPQPLVLTYRLATVCPGWHAVATADGKATWRMPDGSERQTTAPGGPRVLVLPEVLAWAWPLLNPFFWLLCGRFFCRGERPTAEPLPTPIALPRPTLPAPLPAGEERPYEARVKPALIVGLGAVGEAAAAGLVARLRDRGIVDETVEVVAITTAAADSATDRGELDDADRLELRTDLRPYLETLRGGAAATRAWVPWRRWLAETAPLVTLHGVGGDRRKARLALLLAPQDVEQRLAPSIARVLATDGRVLIVAAADDAEGSGLVAEVGHLCATHGASVTAILTRDRHAGASVDALALCCELERLVRLRGDAVASDRSEPPALARQIFDRLVVLPIDAGQQQAATLAARQAAELAWSLVAYDGVEERLPTAERRGEQVMATVITLEALALPAECLWTWVRERTLARAINGQWLGLEVEDGDFTVASVSDGAVTAAVQTFWSAAASPRPQSRLTVDARRILDGQNPVAALLGQLPTDALHHEQVDFHERERAAFLAWCEAWIEAVLGGERQQGRWGVPLLLRALRRLQSDLRQVLTRIDEMTGNEAFHDLTELAASLYRDQLATLTAVADQAGRFFAAFVGEHAELGATAVAAGRRPVSRDLESHRQRARAALTFPSSAVEQRARQLADAWSATHGQALLARLLVGAHPEGGLELRLGERTLAPGEDLAAALRQMLDIYRDEVLNWDLAAAIEPRQVESPLTKLRLGRASARIFTRVNEAIDEADPHLAVVVDLRQRPLDEALGVAGDSSRQLPFAWPEEANAERLADKIRFSSLAREPEPFSALAVHLLRDTGCLHAFFADLATGRLKAHGSELWLQRNGAALRVGEAADGLTAEPACDAFEKLARRVVAVGVSLDRKPIPDPDEIWQTTPDDAVAAVETHPLAHAAKSAPRWKMWRDVIRGLALEVGSAS